jgi:hypothetical protein
MLSLRDDLLHGSAMEGRAKERERTGRTRARVRCGELRVYLTTYLLRKQGVDARMVLGAQKIPFQAHAWVEVNGHAVNERSDVQATYSVWDRC